MNCQAKMHDHYNNKYKCMEEATHEVITETTLKNGRVVKKVRKLCTKHRSRLVSRFRYDIKHKQKNCKITESEILKS